ncbi:MAG: hypothetical protein IIW14_07605, partial [Kiritimatiellae bacterium]|nr:hypothetical protein [Kiritimatiellia bacterium]
MAEDTQRRLNEAYSPELMNSLTMLDQRYEELSGSLVGMNDDLLYANQTVADAEGELNGFKEEVAAAEGEITKYNEVLEQMKQSVTGVGDAAAEAGVNV